MVKSLEEARNNVLERAENFEKNHPEIVLKKEQERIYQENSNNKLFTNSTAPYVPINLNNIQEVVKPTPESFGDIYGDAPVSVMEGFYGVGKGITNTLVTVGTGYQLIGKALTGKPITGTELNDNLKSANDILGLDNGEQFYADAHSQGYKDYKAKEAAIGNSGNTELDKYKAQLKHYSDNLGYAGLDVLKTVVQSGTELLLGTKALNAVRGLSTGAKVFTSSAVPSFGHYIDQERQNGNVDYNTLVNAGISSAVVGGTEWVGGKLFGRGNVENLVTDLMSNPTSKINTPFKNVFTEAATEGVVQEPIQNAAETALHNYENRDPLSKGQGQGLAQSQVLGAASGGGMAAPANLAGLVKGTTEAGAKLANKANQAIQDKVNPYSLDIAIDPKNLADNKYNPVRVVSETLSTLTSDTASLTREDVNAAAATVTQTKAKALEHLEELKSKIDNAETPEEAQKYIKEANEFNNKYYKPLKQQIKLFNDAHQSLVTGLDKSTEAPQSTDDFVNQAANNFTTLLNTPIGNTQPIDLSAQTEEAKQKVENFKYSEGTNNLLPGSNNINNITPKDNITDYTSKGVWDFGDLKEKKGFIIHHTGGRGDVNGVLNTFKQRGFPAHYVIDRDGKVYQILPDGKKGQHIKNGQGIGNGLNNSNTQGVEIIANDDNDVLPIQIEAAKKLAAQLGYSKNQIFAHGEINPHKQTTEGQRTVSSIRGDSNYSAKQGQSNVVTNQSVSIQDAKATQLSNGKWVTGNALLDRFIAIESQGNANAVNGQHIGLFQLNAALRSKYGITNPNDPNQNLMGAKRYLAENEAGLKSRGLPVNTTTLYLAHQQGLGGISQIIESARTGKPVSQEVRKNMDNNGGKGKSAQEFLDYWNTEIENRYNKFAKNNNIQSIAADNGQTQSQQQTNTVDTSELESRIAELETKLTQSQESNNTNSDKVTQLEKELNTLKEQLVQQQEAQNNTDPSQPEDQQATSSQKEETAVNPEVQQLQQETMQEATTRVRANTLTAEHVDTLEQSGAINKAQASELRLMLDNQRIITASNNSQQVNNEVANGRKGKTTLDSTLGLNDYAEVLDNAIDNNDTQTLSKFMGYLERFNINRTNKLAAVQEALTLTPTNDNPIYVVPDKQGNWKIGEGLVKGNKELTQAGAFQVWDSNPTNDLIAKEQEWTTSFLNNYKNIIDARQQSGQLDSFETKTPVIKQSKFTDNPTQEATPTITTTPVHSYKSPKQGTRTAIEGTSVEYINHKDTPNYKPQSDNEVLVGNKFERNAQGKIVPTKDSGLAIFTKDETLATGESSKGKTFNLAMINNEGALGNPYTFYSGAKTYKDKNGNTVDNPFYVENREQQVRSYIDLMKKLTTTTKDNRLGFLEVLKQLQGKKLVTDEYHRHEAQFLDYLIKGLDDVQRTSKKDSRQDRIAANEATKEWIERINPKFSKDAKGNLTVSFEQDNKTDLAILKAEREKRQGIKTNKPINNINSSTPGDNTTEGIKYKIDINEAKKPLDPKNLNNTHRQIADAMFKRLDAMGLEPSGKVRFNSFASFAMDNLIEGDHGGVNSPDTAELTQVMMNIYQAMKDGDIKKTEQSNQGNKENNPTQSSNKKGTDTNSSKGTFDLGEDSTEEKEATLEDAPDLMLSKAESEANTQDNQSDVEQEIVTKADFKSSIRAKLTSLNATKDKIKTELTKPVNARNRFITSFIQTGKTNLSKIPNLSKLLERDPQFSIEMLLDEELTDLQANQLEDFLHFKNNFVAHIKASFDSQNKRNDLKSYLYNKDNELDDNLATALALSVYSWFITDGNKELNTYDDVKGLLNLDKDSEITIPAAIYRQYQYKGNLASTIAEKLGKTVVKSLGIQETKDAKRGSMSELEVSIGSWLISAMNTAGLVHIDTMERQKHLDNISEVGGTLPEAELNSNASEVRFVTLKASKTDERHERIKEIIEASKGTQDFLSRVFTTDVGLRSPKLKQPSKIKRTIKKTKALVGGLQATFINKMQSESIEIDTKMYDAMDHLLETDGSWFRQIIGAEITDEQLAKMHVNDRESAEAAAEGLRRELDNARGFIKGLKRTGDVIQKFWDSIYVARNNRMHYNSNEFNMQTSLIHRMMASYSNFKTTISMKDVTLDNLANKALDADGKPTKLGLFLSALAMNLEGSDSFIKNNVDVELQAYTKDKVPSDIFLPAFAKWIAQEHIQDAVKAMQNVLAKKDADLAAIKAFVDEGDMGIQSFRALVELANMMTAIESDKDLTTAIGLGSDGINNGIALGGIYNGVANTKTLLQTGFIPKSSKFTDYFSTRLDKSVGDYYEAYAEVLSKVMSELKDSLDPELISAIEAIQPAFDTIKNPKPARKFAKSIVIPFGYSAGIGRLVQVAQETFISDIQKQLTTLANKPNEKQHNTLQDNLRILLDDTKFELPTEPNELLEFWFSKKQLSKISKQYKEVVGEAIEQSLDEFAGDFKEARQRNISIHEVTYQMYVVMYQTVIKNITTKRAKELELTEAEFKDRGFTNEEWDTLVEPELAKIMPRIYTAFTTTQNDNQIDESLNPVEESLSGIEVFKRSKRAVANKVKSFTKLAKADNKMHPGQFTLPSKEEFLEKVGVFVNSAQIQGTDARISAEASSMLGLDGIVNLNIHDQNDGGLEHYSQMVLRQNKATFETLASNHIQLNSLETLFKLFNDLEQMLSKDLITEKDALSGIQHLVFSISKAINPEHSNETTIDDIDAVALLSSLIGIVSATENRKLTILSNLKAIQQYAGETGEYVVTDKDLALIEKQRQEVTKRINKLEEQFKAIKFIELLETTKTPNAETITAQTPNSIADITLHSGGAYGADTTWDLIGREFGITKANHYRAHNNQKLSKQLSKEGIKAEIVTQEQLDFARDEVNRLLNRNYKDDFIGNLQARNYYQVVNSDGVYAIAPMADNKKSVTGGTNTAVQLGIKLGKPLYVWDTKTQTWYTWKDNQFVKTDTPILSKNPATVGTRDIENYDTLDKTTNSYVKNPKYLGDNVSNAANQAIRDVYQKTVDSIGLNQENPSTNNPITEDKLIIGDIFKQQGIPVITTNLAGIHGAGLAKLAKDRGLIAQGKGKYLVTDKAIIFPVKGWDASTQKKKGAMYSESVTGKNIDLVNDSANRLITYANSHKDKTILLPMIGLGHGEGSFNDIAPIIKRILESTTNVKLVLADENTNKGTRNGTIRTDNSQSMQEQLLNYLGLNQQDNDQESNITEEIIETGDHKPYPEVNLNEGQQADNNTSKPYGTTKDNPIQIYVDGSDIKGTGLLGFGAYSEYNNSKYELSGTNESGAGKELQAKFPNLKFSNPTMEMLGLLETLKQFTNTSEHIVINQDYAGAVNYNGLWNKSEGSNQRANKPWNAKEPYIKYIVAEAEKVIAQIEANGGSVKINWVKGHQTGSSPHKHGNDNADRVAKSRDVYNTFKRVNIKNKASNNKSTEQLASGLIHSVPNSMLDKTFDINYQIENIKTITSNKLDKPTKKYTDTLLDSLLKVFKAATGKRELRLINNAKEIAKLTHPTLGGEFIADSKDYGLFNNLVRVVTAPTSRSDDLQTILVHEFIHVATIQPILKLNKDSQLYKDLQSAAKKLREWTNDNKDSLDKQTYADLLYALSSLREFVAVTTAQDPIIRELINIPYNDSNLFQEVTRLTVELMKNRFEKPIDKIIEDTIYDNAKQYESELRRNQRSSEDISTTDAGTSTENQDNQGSSGTSSISGQDTGTKQNNTSIEEITDPFTWLSEKIQTLISKDSKQHQPQLQLMTYIFNKIKESGKSVNIQIVNEAKIKELNNGKSSLGLWNNGTIYLLDSHVNGDNQFAVVATVLHELLHDLTEAGLDSTDPNVVKAREELNRIFNHLKAKVKPTGNAELDTKLAEVFSEDYIGEMITYGLTDPQFTKWMLENLRDTKVSTNALYNPKKVLRDFVQAVSQYFGWSTSFSKQDNDNFSAFARLVDKLTTAIEKPINNNVRANTLSATPLSSNNTSTTHDEHLNKIEALIQSFKDVNPERAKAVDQSSKTKTNDSLINLLGLTDKESYNYESVKAVVETFIKTQGNNLAVRELMAIYKELQSGQIKKEHLVNDWSTATKQERNYATSVYNQLFAATKSNMNGEYLTRFVALALTSEKFRDVISIARNRIPSRENTSLFDKLMTFFENTINRLKDLVANTSNKNVKQQIDTLVNKLVAIDTKSRSTTLNNYQKAWALTGVVGDKVNSFSKSAISKAIDKTIGTNPTTVLGKIGNTANKSINEDTAKIATAWLEFFQTFHTKTPFGAGKERYGELRNLVEDFASNTEVKKMHERLVRLTNNIGKLRQKIKDNTREGLLTAFSNNGKNLSKEARDAITHFVLRTDLGSLLDYTHMSTVISYFNKGNRQKEIQRLETKILGMNHGADLVMQSKDLAAYMLKTKGSDSLVKSAQGIAIYQGTVYEIGFDEMNQQLYEDINSLVSLYALDYMNLHSNFKFDDLLSSELDGIKAFLQLHNALIKLSRDEFKLNPYNYIKGYLPEVTNPNRALTWIEQDELDKYLAEGWERINEDLLPRDSSDKTPERILVFHKHLDYQDRVSGSLDLKDTHSKGYAVYDNDDWHELNRVAKDKLARRRDREANQDPLTYNPFNNTSSFIPNFSADGAILNYHYEMEGFLRDTYLERNNDAFELISRLNANLQVQADLRESQRKVARVLYEDYKKNYANNPALFVTMSPDSTDPKVVEDFALMPHAFREEAMKLFGTDMPIVVRASVYNTTFGYKVYSVAKIFDKEYKDRNVLEKAIALIFDGLFKSKGKSVAVSLEDIIKTLTKYSKDVIVIRGYKVLLGNIIANILLLMMHGIDPLTVAKDFVFAWQEGQRYNKAQNRAIQIETQLVFAKGNEVPKLREELMEVNAYMKRSTMKPYMDAGMMSTIVEDTTVLTDELGYQTKLEEKASKVTNKIPQPIKTTFNWLVMNPGTPMYKFMADAAQFSDFAAKYALSKHLVKKGVNFEESLSVAQENFINFDLPQGQGMDYMGRVGFFMFTKFFIRFQKVLTRLMKDKPAQLVAQHLMVENLFDTAGIMQPMLLNNLGNPFDLGMFGVVQAADDVLLPSMIMGLY